MRWSPFPPVALLAILIAEVTALPMPQEGSPELSLERRAVTKAAGKAKVGIVKASNLKKSSQMDRNAALKGKNPTFPVKAGNGVKSKAPKTLPKGKDAKHIFEAKNVWPTSQKAVYRKYSSPLTPAMLKAISGRINSPKTMISFVGPKTDRAKGRAPTAEQSGKTPAKDKNIVGYLGQTIAANANKILKAQRLKETWGRLKEAEDGAVPYGLSVL